MARPLRFVPPNSIVEVTCRTIQARLLLRPSRELNDLLLGVLGRSLTLHPLVNMHAFVFASNHVHLLLSVSDAQALARFMNHFNSNVAREAGRQHGWRDKLWARRYRAIIVADEPSQVGRLRYILSHGTKERLVERPRDWPGISCVRALTEGRALTGNWLDRSNQTKALRDGLVGTATRYSIILHPLPCWHTRSERWRRRQCLDLIREIEREHRSGAAKAPPVLGAESVLSQNPHSRPRTIKQSPAPVVHAASGAVRAIFVTAQRAFIEAFRSASEQLRNGLVTAEFPSFAFPPRLPFVDAIGSPN
jgi:REP element-mobilizing transposase RayT